MQYDPIKKSLGRVFNLTPFLRIIFYKLLDILLLRTWHVKKEFRKWSVSKGNDVFILDAGSGFGQYTYYMASRNKKWKVKAVDVKADQIEDCKKFFGKINYYHVCFEEADLTTFVRSDTFDLILSVDVMEHIQEDVKVFRNFFQSLRKDGMLLISTPSDQGGSGVHEHHGDDTSFIGEHVRNGYNIDDIQEKLRKAGFLKTEAKYQYGPPGKISWKLSMKYPMTILNISKLFFIILPVYYLLTFPFSLLLNLFDVNGHHRTGTGLIVKAWK